MSKRDQPGITRHAQRLAHEHGIGMSDAQWQQMAASIETDLLEVTGGQGQRLVYDMDLVQDDGLSLIHI